MSVFFAYQKQMNRVHASESADVRAKRFEQAVKNLQKTADEFASAVDSGAAVSPIQTSAKTDREA